MTVLDDFVTAIPDAITARQPGLSREGFQHAAERAEAPRWLVVVGGVPFDPRTAA
jgi:hypothetical protein